MWKKEKPTGGKTGSADFGGTNLTAPMGYAGFMVQYNSNGVVQWARVLPDLPVNLAYGGGQIYLSMIASTSGGVTNLSIGGLSNLTDRAYGIAAVNATTGQALWLRAVGGQFGANPTALQDDYPLISTAGSDVFLTGTAHGAEAVFGNFSVSVAGGRGQYFARYDTNGNAEVATTFGGATTMPWASTANASGVYVSGDFDDYSYFGNDLIAAPEYYQNDLDPLYFTQPFVAKFDRDGNPLWARNGVSSYDANFRGIATASDGVWASGFVKIVDSLLEAQFGTNFVISDGYLYFFGTGDEFIFTTGGLLTKITESTSTAGTPVTLLDPRVMGTNFVFSFLSESGQSHIVQSQTNLGGIWVSNMTVAGDGTIKQISVPLPEGRSGHMFFRIDTQ